MLVTEIIIAFLSIKLATGEISECPQKYLRFSKYHTYCQVITNKGVSTAQKQEILDVHNNYRSKIAMGKESGAGGMPKASKMLEMIWDEELAEIAQKLTEKFIFAEDCEDCRTTPSFSVGQNIGLYKGQTVNWTKFLTDQYEEISNFSNDKINPYVPGSRDNDAQYRHFTQMIWDTTWNVGCGMSQYVNGSSSYTFYACNYGPAGNAPEGVMYEIGEPASNCPANACNASSCSQHFINSNYEGLCKVINEEEPPEGSTPEPDTLLYCNFMNQNDCQFSASGASGWKFFHSKGDNYASITLKKGDRTSITFAKPLKIFNKFFCVNLDVRKQPAVAGEKSAGDFLAIVRSSEHREILHYPLDSVPDCHFKFMRISYLPVKVPNNIDYQLTLKFYLTDFESDQIMEIRKVIVKACLPEREKKGPVCV